MKESAFIEFMQAHRMLRVGFDLLKYSRTKVAGSNPKRISLGEKGSKAQACRYSIRGLG